MAGRHGHERVTVRNMVVVRIDTENNLLLVGGGVPGPNGGYVMIHATNMLGKGQVGSGLEVGGSWVVRLHRGLRQSDRQIERHIASKAYG